MFVALVALNSLTLECRYMQEPGHDMSSTELHIKQAPFLWFGECAQQSHHKPLYICHLQQHGLQRQADEFDFLSLACKQDWNVSSIDVVTYHCQKTRDILRSWLEFCLNSPHLHVNFRDGCKALYYRLS